jgi:hypothetical protein
MAVPAVIAPGSRTPRRHRRILAIAVGVVVVAGLAVAAVMALTATMTVTGHLTLHVSTYSSVRGFDDIHEGTAVTVRDEAGTTVAIGRLGAPDCASGDCVYPFAVDDVPGDSPFYEVEVSHRGGVTFSRDDLRSKGAELVLGSGTRF